jgi:hypothetical protein
MYHESNCGGTQTSKCNDSPGFKIWGMQIGDKKPPTEYAEYEKTGKPFVEFQEGGPLIESTEVYKSHSLTVAEPEFVAYITAMTALVELSAYPAGKFVVVIGRLV